MISKKIEKRSRIIQVTGNFYIDCYEEQIILIDIREIDRYSSIDIDSREPNTNTSELGKEVFSMGYSNSQFCFTIFF